MEPHVAGLGKRGYRGQAVGLPIGKAERAIDDTAARSRSFRVGDRWPVLRRPGGQPARRPGASRAACSFQLPAPSAGQARPTGRVLHWPEIDCPVLLLSGESDPFARIDLLRAAIGTLRDAQLITYPRMGHSLTRVLDDALDRIAEFARVFPEGAAAHTLARNVIGPRRDPASAEGAAPRPPRRRAAAVDGDRAGARDGLRRACPPRSRRAGTGVHGRRQPQEPGAVPGRLRAHRRASCRPATRSCALPQECARGPRGRWRRLRRGAVRARAQHARRICRSTRSSRLSWRASDSGSRELGIGMGFIVTAMRQFARSVEIAELAMRHRDQGVVGFDVAGPEAGFPPTRHLDAFNLIHQANFHLTIHAGEAFGLPSIWEALQWCGAERLGHGVRIVDDITIGADGEIQPGPPGELRARQPSAAGDVPDLQRPHRRRGRPSKSIRSTCCAACASASPSTPTTA